MPKTRVVHCKKAPYDIYIGRPSKWGNLYQVGPDGTREDVIFKHEVDLLTDDKLLRDLKEIQGKVLGCWCKPLPCHGDTLAYWADKLYGDNKDGC